MVGVALVGAVLASGEIDVTAAKALVLPLGAMVVGAVASLSMKPHGVAR